MAKIKGLIFDLDGTLTLTQQFHAQAFGEVFKEHGLTYTTQDDLRYAGKGSHCIFPDFFKEHGQTISEVQTEEYSNQKSAIYNRIVAESKIETVPGTKDFLERMNAAGLKMIVATGNKLEAVEIILKRAGLRDYFEQIVTNKDVAKSKPAPDIFLKAAEKLGLPPNECIVFEDAVNGVTAAAAGGIKCIALCTGTPAQELRSAGAGKVVASYDEISDTDLL